MKHSLWFSIVTFFVVLISTFLFNSKFILIGHCQALPVLDSTSFQVVNGSGGFVPEVLEFGISPDMSAFGLLNAYDHLNMKLYDNFGWDLEDVMWTMEDTSVDSYNNTINTLSGGVLSNGAQALQQGYLTAYTTARLFGNSAKMYILGKYDEVSNTITDVFNNGIVNITDAFFDNMSTTTDEMIESGEIADGTSLGLYFGKRFDFSSSYNFALYHIECNYPLFVCRGTSYSSMNNYYTYFICPTSLVDSLTFSGFGVGTSGTLYTFDNFNLTYVSNNLSNYTLFTLTAYSGNTFGSVETNNYNIPLANDYILQNTNDTLDSLFSGTVAYGYLDDIYSLLRNLSGKWVPVDKLNDINNLIIDNSTVINNDTGEPVVDISEDVQAQIQDIIDSINDLQESLNDELGEPVNDSETDPDPDPDPEPDPDGNEYIDIVPPLPPVNTIGEVLTIPFLFSSVFQPIFIAFGGNLFSLWLFLPVIIVFIALIWALK